MVQVTHITSIHPWIPFAPYHIRTLAPISDLYALQLAAVKCIGTGTKPSKSDITRRAMKSRGLGKFVGKHEHHRLKNDEQVGQLQGDEKDLRTGEFNREVRSQREEAYAWMSTNTSHVRKSAPKVRDAKTSTLPEGLPGQCGHKCFGTAPS